MHKIRERERLRELDRYGIFGTPPENDYDLICRLTADLFEAPIALINFVSSETVWVKSRVGTEATEFRREATFCNHTIEQQDVLVVPDLAEDQRFCSNPLVTAEDGLRFYAGAPLSTPGGYAIGTLCFLDRQPRPALTPRERERLSHLAELVMDRLEKRRLERLETMTSSLMEATAEGVIIADADRLIRYWNKAAETIFGFCADEMIERPLTAILGNEDDAAALTDAMAGLDRDHDRHSAPLSFETRSRCGRPLSIEISLARWNGADGDEDEAEPHGPELSGCGVIVRDVTASRAAAERMTWLSRHDEMIGLLNRAHLRMLLGEALSAGRDVAIITLNLDRFMAVNDTFGHQVGDALLKAVAQRLQGELGPGDLLARTGGDAFTILHVTRDARQVEELARRIQRVFLEAFSVEGHLVIASASVGIALSWTCEPHTDALLNGADLAIYHAKAEGGNNWRFFTPENDRRISAVRRMETDLHGALARGEFTLHYQPKFDLADGRITGAEALLRWTHHTRGAVSPADFIPVVELSGLIVPIGEWVLATACEALTRLPPDFRLAVNLSPAQFRRSDVAATVARSVDRAGVDPARLEVEITESLLLDNNRQTAAALQVLQDRGVTIALDDFGTGYSSLAYLHRFPFNTLKIDRSFVQALDTDAGSEAIVRAVIGLGRDFRLKVVAEGIETEKQRRILRDLGCDEGQGYLLGRPMPLEDLLALVG